MNLGEAFSNLFARFAAEPAFLVIAIISIIAFTVLYFYVLKFLLYNNSVPIIIISFFVMIISACVVLFNDAISNALFIVVPIILIILVICLFSTEIKRNVWSKKKMRLVDVRRTDSSFYDEEKIRKCITEIIKAAQDMSKNNVGAIIVLSNGNVPKQIIDSGVLMDSDISSELIESVFFPKTPLHDGAMIISGTKIVAAGCFLPLSQSASIPKDLGTRHRAGLGITETIDVVSLINSEESGIISVAKAGRITRYADTELLKRTLRNYYWKELDGSKK